MAHQPAYQASSAKQADEHGRNPVDHDLHDAQSRIRVPAVIRASNPPDCESGWTQTLAIVIY
jgi:hypothetical protein